MLVHGKTRGVLPFAVQNLFVFMCVSLIVCAVRIKWSPLLLPIRHSHKEARMSIPRAIVGFVLLISPLTLLTQNTNLNPAATATAAADQTKDAAKLDHFDPNLVEQVAESLRRLLQVHLQ